ncbi:tail fiber assembly protein [Citrobacter sp. Cf128]|uniref:tail fiber assembly protein n=1 Tax=Citrobacter sp. Cf128 TaxID=2985076 RepID=UPI0025788B63|nr:tail fiber assembly protein [Citrobacter sp. Cf128]MDM3110658.1 tail fiber assembly protein [Citrobacter sp. Cf128]
MNKYLYDAKTNAFYPFILKEAYIKSGLWPGGGVEVDEAIFTEYQTPSPDKIMVAGNDGYPTWSDIPPLTKEELIQNAENERHRRLAYADAAIADWRTELMLGEISDANRAKLSAWMTYKNEVKSADVTADPENVNWPSPPEA